MNGTLAKDERQAEGPRWPGPGNGHESRGRGPWYYRASVPQTVQKLAPGASAAPQPEQATPDGDWGVGVSGDTGADGGAAA